MAAHFGSVDKLLDPRGNTKMHLVILTGASGSGKTAIANKIRQNIGSAVDVFHFDSIEVPSIEKMVEGWGSVEEWQRTRTLEWMHNIASLNRGTSSVLFEGQIRIAFLKEGLLAAGILDAEIVLIDCDDATRTERLIRHRNQPELVKPTMMSWAAYLRSEAMQGDHKILDTSTISLQASVEYVRKILMMPRKN
jgi:dephospho-CoA kinase